MKDVVALSKVHLFLHIQKFMDQVPETGRLLMQSKAAPNLETMREITKSMNPDTVKDLIDGAGISKVSTFVVMNQNILHAWTSRFCSEKQQRSHSHFHQRGRVHVLFCYI